MMIRIKFEINLQIVKNGDIPFTFIFIGKISKISWTQRLSAPSTYFNLPGITAGHAILFSSATLSRNNKNAMFLITCLHL